MARAPLTEAAIPAGYVETLLDRGGRASWGAFFAGTTVALAITALLMLLGLAIGMATIDPAIEQNPLGAVPPPHCGGRQSRQSLRLAPAATSPADLPASCTVPDRRCTARPHRRKVPAGRGAGAADRAAGGRPSGGCCGRRHLHRRLGCLHNTVARPAGRHRRRHCGPAGPSAGASVIAGGGPRGARAPSP